MAQHQPAQDATKLSAVPEVALLWLLRTCMLKWQGLAMKMHQAEAKQLQHTAAAVPKMQQICSRFARIATANTFSCSRKCCGVCSIVLVKTSSPLSGVSSRIANSCLCAALCTQLKVACCSAVQH